MRMNRGCYTYEYSSRFGGYVYHADGRLAKQNKTATIGQQVRERNRNTPRSSQSEGQGAEKHQEPEPVFTNHEGDVQIMALTGRRSCSRHEGKLLVPVLRPGQRPESDFHNVAVRDNSGKSGPNPVGFSKWGQALPAGSTSGYSKLTAFEGSATKRTQARDEGAQSQFVKRGKPNPVDIQAAHNNRLVQHMAKVQPRKVEKNPRKRGLIKLPWVAQRDLFRDMSQRRRGKYTAAKARIGAIISKKESEKCAGPLESEGVVISARSVDKEEDIIHVSDVETLVTAAVEAAVTSAVDVERVACGDIEAGTGVQLSRKCRKSLEPSVLSEAHQSRQSIQNRRSTALLRPYVKSIDSTGNIKMLFCDTGNNGSSVMALDRFEIDFKSNPGRFSEVVWYDREVSVQGIEKGGNRISMVGAVGQTLYEPGTKRPLKIWTQLANQELRHGRSRSHVGIEDHAEVRMGCRGRHRG